MQDTMRNVVSITLNGDRTEVEAATLADVLVANQIPTTRRGVAVALNGSVVPRARWTTEPITDGDDIEVVGATQGG